MPGKQIAQPPWARRHASVVALIGAFAVSLAIGAAARNVPVAWLIVPAVALCGPAFVSALPYRGATAVAAASALSLVTLTIFTVAVFGESVRANLVMVAVLCVIALYERGVVLAVSFAALAAATVVFTLVDPALVGLAFATVEDRWITIGTAVATTLVTAVALSTLWRDQRSSRHIAEQQRNATEAFLAVAGTIMLVLDRAGVVTVANRQACLTLDMEEHEILGREWFELALPDRYRDDARRLFRATFDRYREFGELVRAPQEYENEVLTRDRSLRAVQWWATFVVDRHGNPTGMVCSGTDITEARATAAALERNRLELDALRRLAQKVASLDDSRQAVVDAAMALTDATLVTIMEPDRTRTHLLTTVASNPSLLTTVIDLNTDPSVSALAFVSGQPQFLSECHGAPGTNQQLVRETGLQSCILQPIVGAGGVLGVLAVGWDHHVPSLSERKAELAGLVAHEAAISLRRRESLAQLERAALIDPLTGISNRRAFDAELPLALRRASDGDYPLALVMIDLNEFKAVNDLLGHEAGDHVLINTSGAWADALRAGDLLSRLGGDEFAVLLPTCDEHEMNHIIERLRRVTPHGPGASIGGALWDGKETASNLIRRADRSQYADKAALRAACDVMGPQNAGTAPELIQTEPGVPAKPRPRFEDPRGEIGPDTAG
ncbi:MAG: sensor domain-containing diguanylate cyclase [Solirubrobacteraceae bacterium]|nr:sensor domain-containing diguanylate cyclase [Solirubrobacteraceae bacterium]